MPTQNTYSTLAAGLQAQIVQSCMDLFKSNSRGYGQGEFDGAKFNEDKQKWIPGSVRWTWGVTTAEHWHQHLAGMRLLGQGVLCDDGCCWYSCLDVDDYEIDYIEAMNRIRRSGLPLVVFRTKSGGLRIAIFFSEPIEAEIVLTRMRRLSAVLGFAGCEIFPKQTKLDVANGDCPSWIFVPFGGTGSGLVKPDGSLSGSTFPEQGCMTDNGGLMDILSAIEFMKSKRITQAQFLELFAAEDTAKSTGKANGKKHPKGFWVQEESYEVTVNTMFCDGPPCLWTIAHTKSHDMQNNFLINAASFLKRKYPENWPTALNWVNMNVLQPIGDLDKLNNIIKRLQHQDYEYMCHQEPICSHCNPHACRRMPYGVGSGNGADHYELGLTIIERVPIICYANIGDQRIAIEAPQLTSQQKFREKFYEHGVMPPREKRKDDWNGYIARAFEEATRVKPATIMKTNAPELEQLMTWLSIYVPTFMRVGEKEDDRVRVRVEERRIYFKWQSLSTFCRSSFYPDYPMRRFVFEKCQHHEQGPGFRSWWRNTYSIGFDMIDEERLEKWLNPDGINREVDSKEGNDGRNGDAG